MLRLETNPDTGSRPTVRTFRMLRLETSLSLASRAIEGGAPRLHDTFDSATVLARTRFLFAVIGGELMLKFTQFPVDALVIAQR